MTHAFFKACLFLGAGSVIHGCGGEQDMRKMGGLKKYMPSTHKTMLIACIAIAGIPPLAGFFSKDEILAGAFGHSKLLWVVGAVTAGLTAFYMFRLYFMTFQGEYRGRDVVGIEQSEPEHGGHNLIPDQRHLDQGDEHSDKAHGHHVHAHDPHESPLSMTGVLWVLAGLACIGGFLSGFDTAVIDSVLDFISYQLSDLAKGYLVAGASIAAAVGTWTAWSRPRGFTTARSASPRGEFLVGRAT
jgi:NAD(P)H-quinone oxidoreductase subunit 5